MISTRQVRFDAGKGFPADENLIYECLLCSVKVPSLPGGYVACNCGNIKIDADGGRMSVRDVCAIALLEIVLGTP